MHPYRDLCRPKNSEVALSLQQTVDVIKLHVQSFREDPYIVIVVVICDWAS